MPADERVLVIPTAHFHALGAFQGFRAADDDYHRALLDASCFSFRPRSEVETDPRFKQLIPYVVIRCGDDVFHYRRGHAGTERRLAALRSIGIGGHISNADHTGDGDPYRAGMMRELAEEVEIGSPYVERNYGFINDDRTLVGSVHLGVVHLLDLEAPVAAAREQAIAEVGFARLSTLLAAESEFETWSQFVLRELAGGA